MLNIFDYTIMPIINRSIHQSLLTGKANIAIAKNSIDTLNTCLRECVNLASHMPNVHIDERKLRINPFFKRKHTVDYCNIIIEPNTKTNRVPKFTECFNFFTQPEKFPLPKDDINGTIHYFPNGMIGKAHIAMRYSGVSYTIDCGIKEDKLQVVAIDCMQTSGTPQKQKLYRYSKV